MATGFDIDTTTAFDAVVCLDGSRRAADALRPAMAIAARRAEDISVLALLDDDTDAIRAALEEQLGAVGIDSTAMTTVATSPEVVQHLQLVSDRGGTPVLSAFGRWDSTGRLFGVLGELVRADVPQVLAVGPKANLHDTRADGCIVVSADGVHGIEPLIAAAQPFVDIPSTERGPVRKVVLAHVVAATEPGLPLTTQRDAHKFKKNLDVRVEAVAVTGSNVSRAIAALARREGASLIIARSWHRWSPQQPLLASSSLSIVAEAPCPVLIVN